MDQNLSFGDLCKRYRAKQRLFLADQSLEMNLSVSLISAIELGKRSIPEGYAEKLATWLHLSVQEKSTLMASVAVGSNVIKFRPKDATTAKFAFEIARRLNTMTASELEKIRETLERGEKIYE